MGVTKIWDNKLGSWQEMPVSVNLPMPVKMTTGALTTLTATITSGQSLSSAINPGPLGTLLIKLPATWTSANLTFQGSFDGSTYFDLYNDSGEYTITGVAGMLVLFGFPVLPYIKIRSGTTGSPVNQGGTRTISVYAF